MRLGAPLFQEYTSPDEWVTAVRAKGYRAAFCPVEPGVSRDEIAAYETAASAADIVIAEVGAWSNPISPDEETQKAALEKCKKSLALADQINARCCVNIAGSRGEKWDGPCPIDLTDETFDMIVSTVREIIDEVNPERSYYTLETMPWMFPDSPDSYLRLIRAIDRERFAVHFDPVNIVCSPQRYFFNDGLIREFVEKLGPHIRSCHAKDILLQKHLTTHLDEVCPGKGNLDYRTYLDMLGTLDPDTPLLLEHLSKEEYEEGAAYIRSLMTEERT